MEIGDIINQYLEEASIDTNLRYNMSFTKKEKAINPNAKCPAIVAMFIL